MAHIAKLKKRLQRKILIITGGSESEREDVVSQIIENTNYYTYMPPKGISFLDYISFIRKKSIEQHEFDSKEKLNLWYNLSFHENWLKGNECLIVVKEPAFLNYEKLYWVRNFVEIFDNHKKGKKLPHLILSVKDITDLKFNLLASPFDSYKEVRNGRSIELILQQNVDFVDLDGY